MRNFLTLAFCLLLTISLGAVPTSLQHQGRLLDDTGSPVTGSISLTYRLFDDAEGGAVLWEETQTVSINDGLFNAVLGNLTPLDFSVMDKHPDFLWLEIQVGTDTPISPRTKFSSAPLASVALSVSGDIITTPGSLRILDPDSDGDTILDGIALNSDSSGSSLNLSKADAGKALNAVVSTPTVALTLIDSTLNDSALIDLRLEDDGSAGMGIRSSKKVAKFKAGADLSKKVNKNADDKTGSYLGVAGDLDHYLEITVDSVRSSLILADTLGDTTYVLEDQADVTVEKFHHKQEFGQQQQTHNIQGVTDTSSFLEMAAFDISDTSNIQIRARVDRNQLKTYFETGDIPTQIDLGSESDSSYFEMMYDRASTVFMSTGAGGSLMGLTEERGGADGTTRKYDITVQPDRIEFKEGIVGGGGGGAVYLGLSQYSMVDTLGDTVITWDTEGNFKSGGKKGYDYYMSKSDMGIISNTNDSLWTVDSLGNAHIASGLRIGNIDQAATLAVAGSICATGNIGVCSDERYKEEITTISAGLDKVMQLRGVSYEWKQEDYPDHNFDDKTHLGFLAQEVEEIFPDMVMTDNNGYKSVDYTRLTPVLVEAIKEQQTQIDDLKKIVEQLLELNK